LQEASRHCRNKEKEYPKAKIDELETNNKIKNIRDLSRSISDFKEDYRPRTDIVQDENGDLVADCHSILARWRNHFSQLLNVHGVNDVRQTELYTSYPLLTEPKAFEFKKATEKLKRHKSPGIDQIPAQLIKAGGRAVCCEIHKLINTIWNEEELPEDWKESIIVPLYWTVDDTNCNNYRGTSLLPTTHKILSNILLSMLTTYAEEIIEDHQCGI
jgi:hypothetical protein